MLVKEIRERAELAARVVDLEQIQKKTDEQLERERDAKLEMERTKNEMQMQRNQNDKDMQRMKEKLERVQQTVSKCSSSSRSGEIT